MKIRSAETCRQIDDESRLRDVFVRDQGRTLRSRSAPRRIRPKYQTAPIKNAVARVGGARRRTRVSGSPRYLRQGERFHFVQKCSFPLDL